MVRKHASAAEKLLLGFKVCISCRALLRLPPFPLARLEMAYMEEPPLHFKAPEQRNTPEAYAAEGDIAAAQTPEKPQGKLTGLLSCAVGYYCRKYSRGVSAVIHIATAC